MNHNKPFSESDAYAESFIYGLMIYHLWVRTGNGSASSALRNPIKGALRRSWVEPRFIRPNVFYGIGAFCFENNKFI